MSNNVKIDWELVGSLLEAGCSGNEIAGHIGIHENTLYQRCKKDQTLDFVTYKAQKQAKGNSLLKDKQYKVAIDGDKTMLVWLGKQRLDQTDKKEIDNKSTDGTMSPNIPIDLSNLTDKELLQYEELQKKLESKK